ncbi:MAG: zinc ribbon domain-containing protein [Firmicutes bacterium]|nr:zinc ribbon domain-containing protein [Bacillota bacterium]
MNKTCKKCGAKLDYGSAFCGNCGARISEKVTSDDKVKSAKTIGKKLKRIAALLIVVIVAVATLKTVSAFAGRNGLLRETMKAVKEYNIDTLVESSSEIYLFADEDDYLEDKYETQVGYFLDMFENTVGHSYRFSYEVNEIYTVSDRTFDTVIKNLENISSDTDVIKKIAIADVTMSASQDGETKTVDVKVYMSKENNSWKLLYFEY